MSRWRVGCLAIVAALVLLPAIPAHATAAASCVDLDNDGTCGSNEPALGPILDANGGFLDTEVASPGFVPPGGSVGVILDNFATNSDSLAIFATYRPPVSSVWCSTISRSPTTDSRSRRQETSPSTER
jgi:hypothetical protein